MANHSPVTIIYKNNNDKKRLLAINYCETQFKNNPQFNYESTYMVFYI